MHIFVPSSSLMGREFGVCMCRTSAGAPSLPRRETFEYAPPMSSLVISESLDAVVAMTIEITRSSATELGVSSGCSIPAASSMAAQRFPS